MNEIKQRFNKLLNQHGYGFQYATLKLAEDLCRQKKSPWLFEAAEFPTEVQGRGTRIDFILRFRKSHCFILAECKRADPKFNNWCFVRAPYVRRNRSSERFLVEKVSCDTGVPLLIAEDLGVIAGDAYNIGLAIKSIAPKGESFKSNSDAIESAASQICRGLNGIIELLKNKPELIKNGAIFIPVIFTTAKIWACDCNLSSANIDDGKLDISENPIYERPWLYYQYHLSPGIKHSFERGQRADEFADVLSYEFIRSVMIVTATGIEEFLTRFNPEWW